MAQLEHIEAIEKRLWSAADTLRANSNFAANEFFLPVMGLIFLRHAYSRYLAVRDDVVKSLPSRGGKTREPTKEDFSSKGAVFLRPEAQFAGTKTHDGGEFFTPVSLVSFIAKVLETDSGIVLDPACGSGGMFVQSARVVERQNENPTEKLTFFGMEKNATTIRLAKMNLAVHGLEGDIKKAITYYEDPHELIGKADFVMAAGAESAGRGDALVRQKLIETGDVDVMVSIRSNFFYTRSVPCVLWFLNRAKKTAGQKNTVLMIDARNVYR